MSSVHDDGIQCTTDTIRDDKDGVSDVNLPPTDVYEFRVDMAIRSYKDSITNRCLFSGHGSVCHKNASLRQAEDAY
eukprot:scaffold684_cov345-Pavlova_lutheri.AAC.58